MPMGKVVNCLVSTQFQVVLCYFLQRICVKVLTQTVMKFTTS